MNATIRAIACTVFASTAIAGGLVSAGGAAQAQPITSAQCGVNTSIGAASSLCVASGVPAGATVVHHVRVDCFGLTATAIPGLGGAMHVPSVQNYSRTSLAVPAGEQANAPCTGGLGAPFWEIGVARGATVTCGIREGIVTHVSASCSDIRPQTP
ncbi:hypothetical protein [Rhodococcus sp. NPDC058514]|uniref:hypothetical protein n=1 Tax=unclassified Rhodococcus (in: high G+C Gram-positive bacteria) TaxID=192944 RepID=UPI0036622EFB